MRRSLTVAAFLILVAGCGSDEGDAVFIRTSFDGAIWSAVPEDAQLSFTIDNPDDAGIWFSVASRPQGGGSQHFSLGLPDPIVEGSFPLNGLTDYAAYLAWLSDLDEAALREHSINGSASCAWAANLRQSINDRDERINELRRPRLTLYRKAQ